MLSKKYSADVFRAWYGVAKLVSLGVSSFHLYSTQIILYGDVERPTVSALKAGKAREHKSLPLTGIANSCNKRLAKMIVIGCLALTAMDLSLGKNQEVSCDTVLFGFYFCLCSSRSTHLISILVQSIHVCS